VLFQVGTSFLIQRENIIVFNFCQERKKEEDYSQEINFNKNNRKKNSANLL